MMMMMVIYFKEDSLYMLSIVAHLSHRGYKITAKFLCFSIPKIFW